MKEGKARLKHTKGNSSKECLLPSGASSEFTWRPDWHSHVFWNTGPSWPPPSLLLLWWHTWAGTAPWERDRSPPWRPVIIGQGWKQQQNRETKPSVKPETTQGHKNSKNLEIPNALWWEAFLKHLCPALKRADWHIPAINKSTNPGSPPQRPI